MKNIIILFLIGILIFFLGYSFIPEYSYTYYYSIDKKNIITKVTHLYGIALIEDVYFTPGYYTRKAIPDDYVRPILILNDDAYLMLIKKQGNTYFFNVNNYERFFEAKSTHQRIKLKASDDYDKWQKMKKNKAYIYITSYE